MLDDNNLRMKKITLFITSLSSGGAEHQLVILSDLLNKNGYNVSIVTFSDMEDHYCVPKGVNRFVIAKGKCKTLKLLSIWKYFLFNKNDVVISFGQRENFLCLLPLIFNRKPIVISGERNVTQKKNIIEKLLINLLYFRSNWIVPNSHTQGRYLSGKSAYIAKKIKVITNYTNLNEYNYSYHSHKGLYKIGVFCRYNVQKNTERFALAIKKLKEQVGNVFQIDWYGDIMFKDQSLQPIYVEFCSLIKNYGIGDVLKLHGKTNKVNDLMKQYDAICLPSLFEGFSNTLSEAICCGKICIASNVSDNPLMVEEGVNGFLFNPKSVDEIVDAFIRYFSTSNEALEKMSRQSRMKAEKLFDSTLFINSYIKCIENRHKDENHN